MPDKRIGSRTSRVTFIVLRYMRRPLMTLIIVYALSMAGWVLIPGMDPDGNPVKGAKVTVVHADSGKGPKPATTNEEGEWKVGGLAFGSWNIDVAAEGFVTRAIVVQFTAGNATTPNALTGGGRRPGTGQ